MWPGGAPCWRGQSGRGWPGRVWSGRALSGDQTWQFVEIAGNVGNIVRTTQNTITITQQKLRLFLGMALLFLDDEKRRFMRVTKDRKQRHTIQMVKRIVAPVTRCNARAVGGQNLTEFSSRKIKLAAKPLRTGNTRHVLTEPAFLLAVLRLLGYVEAIFHCRQLTAARNSLSDGPGLVLASDGWRGQQAMTANRDVGIWLIFLMKLMKT